MLWSDSQIYRLGVDQQRPTKLQEDANGPYSVYRMVPQTRGRYAAATVKVGKLKNLRLMRV